MIEPSVAVAGAALIVADTPLIQDIYQIMSKCRALANFIDHDVATIAAASPAGALGTDRQAVAKAGMPVSLPEEDIDRHDRSGSRNEPLAKAMGEGT